MNGMTVGSNYPAGYHTYVGSNFPFYQPPMWLTSVGQHEQQRICNKYYPQGCPQDVAESMAFANKWGLTPPPMVVQQGKVYGLWKAPGFSVTPMVAQYATDVWTDKRKRTMLLIIGFAAVVIGAYFIVSVRKPKPKQKRVRNYEAESALTKDLIAPARDMIKAKASHDQVRIRKADRRIYAVLNRHGIDIDSGAIPSAFTDDEKGDARLLAKRISCAAQVLESGDDVQAQAVCRSSVK